MHIAFLSLAACLLAAEPARVGLDVDGVKREALVFAPTSQSPNGVPVVFVFHGHGGNMAAAAGKFRIQELWPEAIVVCPQGLPTASRIDPEGKRSGWQRDLGSEADRDLKFFDAILAMLKENERVDASRIYVTGHSNGGGFTYLLLTARPKLFAAAAPCAAGTRNAGSYEPVPLMHIAGQKDQIVPFAGQERTIAAVRRLNRCADQGQEWAKNCTLYPSDVGAPVIVYIHPGGHIVPNEAPALMVRFFKEHSRQAAASVDK